MTENVTTVKAAQLNTENKIRNLKEEIQQEAEKGQDMDVEIIRKLSFQCACEEDNLWAINKDLRNIYGVFD